MEEGQRMKKVIGLTILIVTVFFISFQYKKLKEDREFQITEDSTWGELYRHYDPEGFEALTEQQQEQLDSTLVTDGAPFTWVVKEDGEFVFEFQ